MTLAIDSSNYGSGMSPIVSAEQVRGVVLKLLEYCRGNDWAGYDPYDALNSRLFRALPFLDIKIIRLAFTQFVKRCPINARPLLLVPKTTNPKGISLFISALVELRKSGIVGDNLEIHKLAGKLLNLRSPAQRQFCWGYSFDWQTRGHLVPKGSPNIICTTFAANALLDAYELTNLPCWLDASIEAADFILENLFAQQVDQGKVISLFSYTTYNRALIHNANLLGSALLARISNISGHARFLESALDAARSSVSRQHADGSWTYGEEPHQAWIDNFHTGFNLVALKRLSQYSGSSEFEEAMRRGFDFYVKHFFCNDGAPRYFNDSVYPIDIHSIAQAVITLIEYRDITPSVQSLVDKVLGWGLTNMYDSSGFFYYQKRKAFVIRIPFIRWSEAWMLLAMARFLENREDRTKRTF